MKTRFFLATALMFIGALVTPHIYGLFSNTPDASTLHANTPMWGCGVTIRASNATDVTYHIDLEGSDVRVKVGSFPGTWAKLSSRCSGSDVWIFEPKCGIKNSTCSMDLDCNTQRQYRFRLTSMKTVGGKRVVDQTAWAYFPKDGNSWTTSQTVDIGSIASYFKR